MVKIFDADLIKNHFIITENGKRILIDTGCPVDINEASIRRIPELKQHLEGARRFVDPTLDEFWGLKYFAQHKVLLDYQKAAVIVADQGDEVNPVHPVAEFPISGMPYRILFDMTIGGKVCKMIFDTGASIANYITDSIAMTGTDVGSVFDNHPDIGPYKVSLFELPVDIGGEKESIPFGIMPTKVDCIVQAEGAVGIIGIGLYEKFQVLVDLPNRRLVLGKYE